MPGALLISREARLRLQGNPSAQTTQSFMNPRHSVTKQRETAVLMVGWGSDTHVAAAVQADADGGQANSACAGVHQHAVARLQAAAHDESIVGGQKCHGDRGRIPQGPPLGDLPHLQQAQSWLHHLRLEGCHSW